LIPQSSTTSTTLSREQIATTPGADSPNSLNMITNYVPSAVVVHDQLHIRGGHQVSWLLDGVPVPNTNIASNVGPQFDPRTSTTSRFSAADTRRSMAIAHTESSTW